MNNAIRASKHMLIFGILSIAISGCSYTANIRAGYSDAEQMTIGAALEIKG